MTGDASAVVDMSLAVPADPGYAGMVRDLAVHGARVCGCIEAKASAFGRQVEDAAREALAAAGPAGSVAVTVRRDGGPLEISIGNGGAARSLALEI